MSADRRRRWQLVVLELVRLAARAVTVTLAVPLVLLGCVAGLAWLALTAAWAALGLGFDHIMQRNQE